MGGEMVGVGRPTDVTNVNPFTQNAWNTLQGIQGQFGPTQNIASLQGVMPGIQNIAGGLLAPYGQSLFNSAEIMGNQAMRDVANQFSQNTSLNSGAALSAMSRGMAQPLAEASTQYNALLGNLGGGLANTFLGQAGGAYQAGLQGLTGYGTPEYWQPQYTYQPGFFEQLMGGLGGGAQALGGIGQLFGAFPTGGGGGGFGGGLGGALASRA